MRAAEEIHSLCENRLGHDETTSLWIRQRIFLLSLCYISNVLTSLTSSLRPSWLQFRPPRKEVSFKRKGSERPLHTQRAEHLDQTSGY